jgi:cytochrome c-type biogenesis protein CcmH/NrfF
VWIRVPLVFLAVAACLRAQALTAGQAAVFDRVTTRVLAPCCWREQLKTHQSPEAQDLRLRVATLARSGIGEEEILNRLIAGYGERILREPRGAKAVVSVGVPWAVVLTGVVALTVFLRRLAARPASPPPGGTLPEIPDIDN